MNLHLCTKEKPPHGRRVMTFTPAAVHDMTVQSPNDSITILCWNQTEKRWCDDNGESHMFGSPKYWWEIEVPDQVAEDAGVARRKRRQVRALRESHRGPSDEKPARRSFLTREMWDGFGFGPRPGFDGGAHMNANDILEPGDPLRD